MATDMVPTTSRAPLSVVALLCLVVLVAGSAPRAEGAFSTPANLTVTIQDSSDQQVASSGSNVYLVWRDNPSTVAFNPEILMMQSTDGGKTFAAWQNLSSTS